MFSQKANILVVDDEPVTRQSLTDILRLEGYSVASVAGGQAAIQHIRTHHIDLMIIDLRMPGMTGLEAIQAINQISDVEIILLTAYGSTESAVEALRLRIHDYLFKPASPAQVLSSVRRGLERRMARLRAKGMLPDGESAGEIAPEITLRDGTHIDLSRRMIRSGEMITYLTPAEGRLMQIFFENAGRVFSHRELVLLVQGYETAQHEAPEILRPLVSRLRHKLEVYPALANAIVSIRGTGYVYEKTE
jgi:DNA-binding response OmpR family regulator